METILIFTDQEKAELATAIKLNIRSMLKGARIIIVDDMDLHAKPLWDFVSNFSPVSLNIERREALKEEKKINKNVDEIPNEESVYIEGEESYERMEEYFIKYTPSYIITIGHGAFHEAIAVKKKLKSTTKVVQYVADYTLNKQLVDSDLDGYIVENLPLKKSLIACGINAEKIQLSAVPVEDKYFDEDELRGNVRLSLSAIKPTLLYLAYLDNEYKDRLNVLKNYEEKFNLLVYCGYNHECYKRALKLGLNSFNEGVSLPMLFDKAQIVLTEGNFYDIAIARNMGKLVAVLNGKLEMQNRNGAYLNSVTVDCMSEAKLNVFLARYNAKDYYSLSLRSKVVAKGNIYSALSKF